MSEERPTYQITEAEPEPKLTRAWQKRLHKKALQMQASQQTCALTVVFHADGCVTFFEAAAGGRVCP